MATKLDHRTNRKSTIRFNLILVGTLILPALITGIFWWNATGSALYKKGSSILAGFGPKGLFTKQFPNDPLFRTELKQLRAQGKLVVEDEVLINRVILAAADELQIPPAMLWCLLYQESRLNHLAGLDHGEGSSGIGQFTSSSFYEINHQIARYTPNNLKAFYSILGKDVRPVGANRDRPLDPSSYYYIPTGVIASASFLNNRYHHLLGILEKQKIKYDPDVLWLYSAAAYNKGTRSVLTVWNYLRKENGVKSLEDHLASPQAFAKTFKNEALLRGLFLNIWTPDKTERFAKELTIHTANIQSCALNREGT